MGGHHGIVRAWCPVPIPTTSCTAGEDTRICDKKNYTLRINTISSLPPDVSNTSVFESEPMDNSNDSNDHRTTHRSATTATTAVATNRILGGPIRRQRRSSNTTTKPYWKNGCGVSIVQYGTSVGRMNDRSIDTYDEIKGINTGTNHKLSHGSMTLFLNLLNQST